MTHGRYFDFRRPGLILFSLVAIGLNLQAADGPVVITRQPTNAVVLQGTPATFSVEVDGTPPFSFQWMRNGGTIASANSSSYSLPTTAAGDDESVFSVRVINGTGDVTSLGAILYVDPGMIVSTQVVTDVITLSNLWRYDATGTDRGTSWRDVYYEDDGWLTGYGIFDGKNTGPRTTIGGETVRTVLPLTNSADVRVNTYYFRTHFTFTNANAARVDFAAQAMLDDGAVFYINGQEMAAVGVNSGAGFNDFATVTVGDATYAATTIPGNSVVVGDNVMAVQLHQINATSSDVTFGLKMDALVGMRGPDTTPLVIEDQRPPAGSVLRNLNQIEIFFSKRVDGVDASDLLINGIPATNVIQEAPTQFVFEFPVPATGTVQVTWAATHGIHDITVNPKALVTTNWTYRLDPNAMPASVYISEFMARNDSIIRDEDGDYSDWIELYNAGATPVNMAGWYLTDQTNNLRLWRFPSVTIPPNSYLLVFASGKDKTNATARLHTNFQLAGGGEYLALVDPDGIVASEFSPTFPAQVQDVSYGRDRLNPLITGFFYNPTPNAANSTSGAGVAPEVRFSRPSGTFVSGQPFSLELSTPYSGVEIRYLLITNSAGALTNMPTTSSLLYTNPILISVATGVRVRTFQPGMLPGAPQTEYYIPIDGSVVTNSSDIPMVLLYNFGAGAVPSTFERQPGIMMTFEPINGRTSMTNPPVTTVRMGMHLRGSSTRGYAKGSFAMETYNEFNEQKNVEVLGMPEESDWVFYAPNNFEPIFIHNPFMHQLSRDVGRYSPRTAMAEVYLNTAGGIVSAPSGSSGNYNGIYVVEEKIKRGQNRVDVDKLQFEHTNAPSVSGGYVFKIDRNSGDDVTFSAGSQGMVWVSPDGQEITQGLRNAQRDYLIKYVNDFYAALSGVNFTNPVTGYAPYIDVDSWIDNHLLNILSFNVDAYRLSGFLFKDRNGRIEQGPLWDFDRTLGSADNRDFNPRVWRSRTADYGTDMFNVDNAIFANPWWSKLFRDLDFWQRYIDRYQELRRKEFSTNHLHALVDKLTRQCMESQRREFTRWGTWNGPRGGTVTRDGYAGVFNSTYQGEIDFMKKWLTDRVDFMDTNFLAAPRFSTEGGPIPEGFSLVLFGPTNPPGSIIYYTLDGSDPRAWNSGGQVAPNAMVYTGPIVLTSNARVVARAFNTNHSNVVGGSGNPPLTSRWSGPMKGTFYVSTPPLRITEIMYHAQSSGGVVEDDQLFDYIEVKNISSEPLNLANFRVSAGIDFLFPDIVLGAGESGVVVANTNAFQSRYGTSRLILGQYTNTLDNAGESIKLRGPLNEPILDFDYEDDWYPITDGLGFSLVVRDENAPLDNWDSKTNWRPSGALGGSPGTVDPVRPSFPLVLVNEVLTHTDPPAIDTVELYNASSIPADITGWYLTDNFNIPKKYRITPTVIQPGQYALFNEAQFNVGASNFAFSSHGEEVYIFSADANGNLTGYFDGWDFGAALNGVTFGRYVDSVGKVHNPAQITPTLGTANSGPRVGPIVISEVMYHPQDNVSAGISYDNALDEYIELYNITDQPVPLFDPSYPSNRWVLRDAVDFLFPTNVTVGPTSFVMVVAFDPTDPVLLNSFRARYGLPVGVPVFGPFKGKLQNDGESVELARPDMPEPAGTPDAGFVPYPLADKVRYYGETPWPLSADGGGHTLQRVTPSEFGNDPINWVGASPTPGAPYVPSDLPVINIQPRSQYARVGSIVYLAVGATGSGLRYQWRFNGANIPGATTYGLSLGNVQMEQSGEYQCLVMNAAGAVASTIASVGILYGPGFAVAPEPQFAWGSSDPATYGVVLSNVYFGCVPSGSLPLSYQWRLNGNDLPGQTGPTLALANATSAQEGSYSVVISNYSGAVTSAPVDFRILLQTAFLEQPQSTNLFAGNTLNLRVRIQGGPAPFGYRWERDGVVLTNMVLNDTQANLTLTGVRATNSGIYTVTVTNAAFPQGVTSEGAAVVVAGPPVIVTPPATQTAYAGSTVTLRVEASGAPPLTYRWMFKIGFLAGQTNSTLVLTNVQAANAGAYRVQVTNPAGSVTSPGATLSVVVATLLSQPQVLADGTFKANLAGVSNTTYRVQYSSDLTNWSDLTSLTYTNGQMPFIDSSQVTNSPQRFYRATSP